jgi:very-short-patch-repair endonuclease/DNA modification methylase
MARRSRRGIAQSSAKTAARAKRAESYAHPEAQSLLRPDVGTQAQFRKKKPPQRYRYDSSLSPALDWDGQNPAREAGEALIRQILDAGSIEEAKAAAAQLKALSRPFLNWAGKAERLSFDVPTLPLFVHERLSTKAILETLKGHKRDRQLSMLELFNDPQHPIHDQVLRAYEYPDNWVNRLILGDSLVVMSSLLHYESLGGQVQMIYMDPPYGVKFGSNFQPFVRKRDVKHNDDAEMTREPEMVKAYRDTWELGLHSYLTYLRDRLLLCRELLAPCGSIFVQIGDENLHHVREVLEEVFGTQNFAGLITFQKTTGASGELLSSISDYLLWFARDRERLRYRQLYLDKAVGDAGATQYSWAELPEGMRKNFGSPEGLKSAPPGSRTFVHDNITSQRPAQGEDVRSFTYEGRTFTLRKGTFKTDLNGLNNLAEARRLLWVGDTLRYVRYLDDFPVFPLSNLWDDTVTSGFAAPKLYAVQTNPLPVQRCLLMTTDPGDFVLDPTCVRRGTRVLTPLNPPASGGRTSPAEGSANGPSPLAGRVGVGSVPVEHLRHDDWVYAHDGQPRRVIRTLRRNYSGSMIGIRHDDAPHTLWLTADHLVLSERYVRQMSTRGEWSDVPREHFGRARELRRSLSPPEATLWKRLRSREIGIKFRRQHPIGPYIADFYSRQAALVVEVDGEAHVATEEAVAYDRERDRYMEGVGLRVLRFPAADVSFSTDAVLEVIADRAREAVLDDDPTKQWRRADHLKAGDIVFTGVARVPCRIAGIERQESVEEVYDLEVEGAHSFLTEVCAVHNCGSGTTAYVAEQCGRRWIAIDTSRVPLALARQRLLTATFPFYQLKEERRGPAGGFVYVRKQNNKGEEVGGIVPHVTLKSIANNEPPDEEVLVDRPEVEPKITRVTGSFCVEATIPTPVDWEGDGVEDSGGGAEQYGSFVDRMLEVLRRSPCCMLGVGRR